MARHARTLRARFSWNASPAVFAIAGALAIGCKRPAPPDLDVPGDAAVITPPSGITPTAAPVSAHAASSASSSARVGDGGVLACKRLEGPKPSPALRFTERAGLRVGAFEYSLDAATGAVQRKRADGTSRVVATARPGTHLAAATIGDGHSIVAYLANRTTTEGVQSQAFVVLDDGIPVRLSEDGSGATSVELAPRGRAVVAVLVDARTAMTPVHARILEASGDRLSIGNDAVVFVGGTPERRTAAAIATSNGKISYVLVAMAESALTFGMATIRIDDVPKDDAPVSWSLYPNGLDPAPVVATHGHETMYFARVRPALAEQRSPRILEVGRLSNDGVLTLLGVYASGATLKNLTLDADAGGVLTLGYDDDAGSWTQRLFCAR
jgi:hypothetical protein